MGNKTNTRDRILDIALQLFNENGCHAVTTNHIAEAAGLSVGNLYYHFKNKEEIIRALYQRLSDETRVGFALAEDRLPDIADLERLLQVNFVILWKYRFFYREIMSLIQRDPLLAQAYQELRERGFSNFQALFHWFASSGVFRPAPEEEINRLAEICWIISEFYLSFVEIGGMVPTDEHRANGIAVLRQVLQPYITTPNNN